MDMQNALTQEIIEREWQMFQQVENRGGRAVCQNNLPTFRTMRSSQCAAWSEALLESYLNDLKNAKRDGRNLLTEKYARMMESTAPGEYAAMAHLLPKLTPEVNNVVEAIVPIVIDWELELQQKYPHILAKGRPLHTSHDSARATSLETYLRCELQTYSLPTLRAYLSNVENYLSEGSNASAVTMQAMMQDYNFSSLEEANESLAPANTV